MDEVERVLAAIGNAWEQGCPVASATPDTRLAVANFAVRRWRSSSRRLGDSASKPERIRDLANGLAAHLQDPKQPLGPEMRDYEFLAREIAAALEEA